MWTAPLSALLLQLALALVAALVVRRSKLTAALLGGAAFLGAPWLAGPVPLLRGLTALIGGIGLLRIIDLVRSKEPWDARRRLFHVMTYVDSRTLRAAPRQIAFASLGRAILWAALAVLALEVAASPQRLARWAGGLVFAYAAIEAGYQVIGATYRAIGFVTPPLHVLPIASLSVAELWGMRWARPISAWIRETCFNPLARRGHARIGVVLGFLASAVGHAYPIVVASSLAMAGIMFAFFVVQALFITAESALRTSRWPRWARRTWTITLMVASSPLFVEPALHLVLPPT